MGILKEKKHTKKNSVSIDDSWLTLTELCEWEYMDEICKCS